MIGKHTPGQWKAAGILVQYYRPGDENRSPRWMALPETEGNARLIAAAPDLLAALKRVVNLARLRSTPDCTCIQCTTVADARAAIAKAEGGA